MDIEDILNAIRHGRVRITDHADAETLAEHLSFDEVLYSVRHGEIMKTTLMTDLIRVV